MNVIVVRQEVARLAVAELRDGACSIAEGLDFVCSCSCIFTIGIRFDNDEKTFGADPCDTHRPYYGLILEEVLNDSTAETTEEALAEILSRIPEEVPA